jgi:hypothetical protein
MVNNSGRRKIFNLIILRVNFFHGTPHHYLLYHKNKGLAHINRVIFIKFPSNFLDLFKIIIYNSGKVIALLRHKNIDAAFKFNAGERKNYFENSFPGRKNAR